MSNDKTYNGWKNYETWLVNIWLSNDQGTHECWQERAKNYMNWVSGDEKEAAELLSSALKDWTEEGTPELTGLYADLINAALSEVDWYEIAEHYISDCGWEPDDEELEEEEEDTDEEE